MNNRNPRAWKLAVIMTFPGLLLASYFLGRPTYAESFTQTAVTQNPVQATVQNLALGLDHFDAHCAVCHAKTGKADTEQGKSTGAADLTAPATQGKSDAELFNIISNGIPGTAMPAFSKTHSPDEIWHAVLLVRHLPMLTAEERAKLEAAIPPEARHHHGATDAADHQHPDQAEHAHEHAADETQHEHGATQPPHEHAVQATGAGETPAHHHDMPSSGGQSGQAMNGMSMGPLLVMAGEEMGVRVGDSDIVMPMGEEGSGTSRMPASSPMYMYHKMFGEWLVMFHFNANTGAVIETGPRGAVRGESLNWFMPMALLKVGRGTLRLRGMFSAEPFTFAPGGTPELFQTGETYKGRPLIDHQHPHDLFMELSATYTVPIGEQATWFGYFGYPGEPALGPTAFMHRQSASENPAAPLAHHLQDSTHISFGVFTTGFTYKKFKAEGSIFNGQEPDENRYNFEAHSWASRSVRLSFAPTKNWEMQWSYGYLNHPEALENTNQLRMTASAMYTKSFDHGWWSSSLIWGRNHIFHGDFSANLNGYTAESTVNFRDKNYLYTRLELVDKNELLRPEDEQFLGITPPHPVFRIGVYTFGGDRDIITTDKLSVALGGDVTLYSMPSILTPLYGNHPTGLHFFVRIRPRRMTMHDHGAAPAGKDHDHMEHPE